ncbi:anthocyanin 5-aromatic acyltransferase-like [Solanum tuberosum]|uniref:Malonyltransferase n=1 Tax=Solanum tuberosum TaxID=4113 RepID=M1DGS7_SOLTU|nr:PREDICTED: anthocyanin 5-aromatic acyltransferase-like [Solanum tuberosum]
MASIIEQCQVAPPTCATDKLTLPLTCFDTLWILHNHHIPRILFYKLHNIDKNSFIQNIIPTLKHSLSLTLKHYLPLAGNLVCPWNSTGYPELRYVKGDSVSVTFSESTDMDFDYLVSNDHTHNAKDFHPFVPKIAEPKDASGVQFAPVLAIQVTLFPNHGISISFLSHHVVGDESTIVGFIKSWALLNKNNENDEFIIIPFYDRSIVKDPYGLGDCIWEETKKHKTKMSYIIVTPPPPPDNNNNIVRGTFTIRRDHIDKLKNLILSKRPSLTHVTSYTVTGGYVWSCLVKSEVATEIIDENVMEYFGCAVNYRARFDPPLPSSYFGNCIIWYIASTKHVDLVGNNEGFIIATESIAEIIYKRNKDEEYVLNGDWLKEVGAASNKGRYLAIAGSPKYDLYEADFGWGKPKKWHFIFFGSGLLMSLSKSKDSDGDLEIGLYLPKTRMNAFAAIFTDGLSVL